MENQFTEPMQVKLHVNSNNIILEDKKVTDQKMIETLNPFLEKYFSNEEINYIKTGNIGTLQFDQDILQINSRSLFLEYFPFFRDYSGSTPEERSEPQKEFYGTREDMVTKLVEMKSEYFGNENHEYKGNIATSIILRIVKLLNQKERLGNSLISKNNGFFKNISEIPTISVGDFNIRPTKKQEYLNGLPLFLGELAKTCQVIGKSGGKYGLDYLLNENVETLVFTKNIVIGNSIQEVILGSPAVCVSEDKKKIIISAIELINIPAEIASTLLRGIAQALYEKYKDEGIKEVQVGIGARTLHDLGYDKFIDGKEGCPEYNRVRAQNATVDDINRIARIARGEIPAVSEEELRVGVNQARLQRQSKLVQSPLNGDAEDIRPTNSVLGQNRDIRYRISLCDANTCIALKEQVKLEKTQFDKEKPSVFTRIEDIICLKFNLKSTNSDNLRKEYFRE